jgi:hypothetical protein
VQDEWKNHGREVLKNLATKKIIKEIKPAEIMNSNGKAKPADLTNRIFEVEMIYDVLEFIKEAKYMDSLGVELSRNIQNLVLNENRYYFEINNLNYMLNEYNEIQNSFTSFEKKTIMSEFLKDLGKIIDEGTQKDWKSINKQTYILRCMGEINKINKTRLMVVKDLTTINAEVKSVYKLDIVTLQVECPSMADFMYIQNENIKMHNARLSARMDTIKNSCNIIEFIVRDYAKDKKDSRPEKDKNSNTKIYESLKMFKF